MYPRRGRSLRRCGPREQDSNDTWPLFSQTALRTPSIVLQHRVRPIAYRQIYSCIPISTYDTGWTSIAAENILGLICKKGGSWPVDGAEMRNPSRWFCPYFVQGTLEDV